MPNDFRVRAATLVSTQPEAGVVITDQQMENNIMAYCRAKEIETEGLTKPQILNTFTKYIWDEVRRTARQQLLREKRQLQESSLEGELNTDLGT